MTTSAPVQVDDVHLRIAANRIYTDLEAADLLRLPVRTVRLLIKNGDLRGFAVGKIIRVQGQALLDFARGGGVSSVYTRPDTVRRRRTPAPRKARG